MATDLSLRFRGDPGNAPEFFTALGKYPDKVVDQITAANTKLLRLRAGLSAQLPSREGVFLDVRNIRTEVSALDNLVKVYGQLGYVRRTALASGGFTDSFTAITDSKEIKDLAGNFDDLTDSMKRYNLESGHNVRISAQVASGLSNITQQVAARRQTLGARRQAAEVNLTSLRSQLDANLDRQLELGQAVAGQRGAVRYRIEAQILQLQQQQLVLEQQIAAAVRERTNARRQEARALANDTQLARLSAQEQVLQRRKATADARLASATAALGAQTPVTSLPKNYTIIPQQLRQILERGGLRPQAGQSVQDYLQRQTFNAPRYDLVREVTRFSGAFERGDGIIADWSAEVDKAGKVVTRFGGQLSGPSQILKQISRDFQKVIEWTVATTFVFGSLQYAVEQLRSIKEIDYSLAKFAITAQKSPAEARDSFAKLAEVAYNTATPLLEVINAADDIALATQRAGQSTDDWSRQIYSLTESVGVFTNLTGTDTVTATDLLTATMKQLRLTAQDIPAILSKITAVAGGQSQAISDITKGLSAMAEAGRIANLTVDQQIATIQVLSQVTSKTPAEVATAFKNLVGSLGSPAALKELERFNIAVRDQEGNLRNILDVYGEIADKVKSGIIPAADVQGLVRAISGGPRRAPDAAALLSAIEQITAAEQKSANATNEAAIANAKAIDTTKSKLIQLQTTIDAVTFEKFGGEFKSFVGAFTNLITSVLNAFGKIPTGLVSASIQIGLFFVAVRGGTRILSFLISYLKETAKSFIEVGLAARTSSGLVNRFGQPLPSAAAAGAGTLGSIRGNLGRLGLSAGVGAALSAATGGGAGQIIGGGLQGLGIALLAFPEPTLLTKVAGGIALLGGTLLQFFNDTKDANVDQAEKAVQILDAFAKFKDSSFNVSTLTSSQKELVKQIDTLNAKTNKNAEEVAQLDSAQREYAKGLLESIDATKAMNASRQQLIDILKSSADPNERAVATELELAGRYGLTGKALDDLIIKYQKIILLRANPDLVFPDLESIPAFNFNAPAAPATGSTEATRRYNTRAGPREYKFDLKALESDSNKVKDLFDGTGKSLIYTFQVTQENIQLVTNAINSLKASGDPLAQTLAQTFNAFVAQNDIISQTANNLAIYQSYIDGLTFINPEKAAELQKIQTLIASFANTLPATASPTGPDDRTPLLRNQALKFLEETLKTQKVDYQELKTLAEEYFRTLPPEVQAATTPLAFMAELFTRIGISLDLLGIKGPAALQGISEAAIEAGEALQKSTESLTDSVVDRLASLQADLQGGNISPADFSKSSSDLKAYLDLVSEIGPKFSNAILDVTGFNETLQSLQGSFSDINGLQNAALLSTDEFINHLLALGDTYGLNKKQLGELRVQLLDFFNLVSALNTLKVNIPIGIKFDLASVRQAIANLKKALSNYTGTAGLGQVAAQFDTLRQLETLLRALEGTSTNINNIYKSGSGSSSGGSRTKSGRDISELYLPEEIATASNAQELINQAIANARKLQSQIPGATKEASNDLVVIIDGLTKVMQVSGVKQEYLQKALDALTDQMKRANEKADVVRRIRVGAGDFSAIANVPVNSQSGVSVAGSNNFNVTFNLGGTTLTPAQFTLFANMIAAEIARRL